MKLRGNRWSIEWGVAGPPVAFGSEFSSTMVGKPYVELSIRGQVIDLSGEDLGPLHAAIRHGDRGRCNEIIEEFAAKAKSTPHTEGTDVIPIQMRDGVPLCPDIGCGAPMVQVAEPSESYPGGGWQCPIGRAQLDAVQSGLRRAFDRLAN